MLKNISDQSYQVNGVETAVDFYAFESEAGSLKLLPHEFHEDDETHLNHCAVGWVGQTPVIRSGSVDTKEKADELLFLAKNVAKVKSPLFHVGSTQVCSVEKEGNCIHGQHICQFQYRQFLHLSFPLEKPYLPESRGQKLKNVVDALEKFQKWINVEAWLDYCSWYSELLEKAFSHFVFDAIDEYTLEGQIKNFQKEVKSLFLVRSRKRLEELQSEMCSAVSRTYQDQQKAEKEMCFMRNDMQGMLLAHYEALDTIVKTIPIVEKAHYASLKITGMILAALLGDEVMAPGASNYRWGTNQMLLQLLEDEFGVISAVNGAKGRERTTIAFALRLAVLQLKQQYPLEDVVDFVLHSEETVKMANKGVQSQNRLLAMLKKFRSNFIQNLERLPFTPFKEPRPENSKENPEVLFYLPSHLVRIDPDSGEPIALSEEGYHFFNRLE